MKRRKIEWDLEEGQEDNEEGKVEERKEEMHIEGKR